MSVTIIGAEPAEPSKPKVTRLVKRLVTCGTAAFDQIDSGALRSRPFLLPLSRRACAGREGHGGSKGEKVAHRQKVVTSKMILKSEGAEWRV